jgi:NAD(P)-dependent dehydrogenase (short-subunit alcohol dehydrogenase family)
MDAAFRLDGKVAVVTGALGFLGTHYTAVLANAGAHVVVADVDDDGCRRRAEELTKQGLPSALGVGTDVSGKASVDELVACTVTQFGRLDVLVNNAATKSPHFMVPFENFPLADWDQVMAVNLTGVFLTAQAAGRQMLVQGHGVIVNVASHYGVVGPDFRIYPDTVISTPPVYTASKAGVIGLTRYLATYWAGKNIRVNCLSPGGVYNNHSDQFVKNYSSRVPLGRMAEPSEMGPALLFLASEASSYLNGHNLIVDGGWTAW